MFLAYCNLIQGVFDFTSNHIGLAYLIALFVTWMLIPVVCYVTYEPKVPPNKQDIEEQVDLMHILDVLAMPASFFFAYLPFAVLLLVPCLPAIFIGWLAYKCLGKFTEWYKTLLIRKKP